MFLQTLCECVGASTPSVMEVLERNANAAVCIGNVCASSLDELLPMAAFRRAETSSSGMWAALAVSALALGLAVTMRKLPPAAK